jgi:glutathione synthase/RimK-type ligase-like ATP-grasp enzyme
MIGWLIYDSVGHRRNNWFIEQLCFSAKKRGIDLRFVPASRLRVGVIGGKKTVFFDNNPCDFPDFVICRTIFPLLSEFFESAGVAVFNSSRVSRICNDKRATHLFFADSDIPMADSFFCNRLFSEKAPTDFPSILKSVDGHGGKEVFWLSKEKDYENQIANLEGGDFLLQKPLTPGRDVRVYLLDGEIIFAALRSCDTDFRSNYSLGGSITPYTPCDEMRRITALVNQKLSPFYVGVDFIFDTEGRPVLNEVEDVVGARMIYELTDIKLHELYVEKLYYKLKTL